MFNKSNFCHIASNNRNEQKGSVFIYKTSDTLAQVTQSGYFNEKLIDINLHDLIIHVQYDPVARTLKKSVLIVTERTMDNVETAPILDQTIGDDIADLGDQVAGIEEKIPGAASAANQLADKAFVNDIKTAIETTIAGINTSISTLNNDLSQTNQNLAQTNQDVDSLQETKQDIATAVNYDNITNCITEIPQDIKLELADGVLTLKAGSTVYVPNGTGVFDVITTKNDLTVTASTNGTHLVGLAQGFGSLAAYINAVSGTTEPTLSNGLTWYDTANNVIKRAWGGSWQNSLLSLPLAAITVSNGAISSIDQVFNGFGYIGSTIFALPGVKGLIPNGRNEDGTLKNIDFTTGSVLTQTLTGGTFTRPVILNTNVLGFNANASYDEKNNTVSTGNYMIVGTGSAVGGKITSFETKTAFHAVDYSDFESTVEEINSSISAAVEEINSSTTAELANKANTNADNFTTAGKGTIVNLTVPNYSAGVAFTLNASTSYTAPKDGVVFILTGRANDQGSNIKIDGTAVADTISNWSNIPYFFPVAKGTVVSTSYDTISTAIFYPLKGAN